FVPALTTLSPPDGRDSSAPMASNRRNRDDQFTIPAVARTHCLQSSVIWAYLIPVQTVAL
ncbi:MAG: hypothetical protein ACOVO0_12965, partial [Burkholderiaceae bacterium]